MDCGGECLTAEFSVMNKDKLIVFIVQEILIDDGVEFVPGQTKAFNTRGKMKEYLNGVIDTDRSYFINFELEVQ